ncbi:tautomerase family protein [uncultured Nocardioides sp.]|uniref:tautomerase family protein n=1 Tax=uncultured Nocardioides sp. TaxID=198441 RepID=UPI002624DB23|nr:tautomerase family protein [uncultured Nocardioides sp.]
MPTYHCTSERGTIPPEARAAVAAAITEIHHEVARAPRYFVQVVFTDLEPGSIYLAGHPVEAGHV